jgi:hypothetical protein
MLDARSGKFVRGGSTREFSGRPPTKEVLQAAPTETSPVIQHRWHGKGLQKQERLKKSILSGRVNKDPANFSRKNGRGLGGWGNDELEARNGGYDDEDVGMDEVVDTLDNYVPPEPNVRYAFGEADIVHKQLDKKSKPDLVQPESHKNPDKQYADNWLDAEEYDAYEKERALKERERSRSNSPNNNTSSDVKNESSLPPHQNKKHHGGVKHGKGKHSRIHHHVQSPPPIPV